jgi:N-acetyl-anhydromuramyl-L-alanine amidase AmpD
MTISPKRRAMIMHELSNQKNYRVFYNILIKYLGHILFILTISFNDAFGYSYEVIQIPSLFFKERGENKPIAIITHCMGADLKTSLELLTTNTKYGVSTHYFIPQLKGWQLQEALPEIFANINFEYPDQVPVLQIVPEEKTAFHAGKSSFSNLNIKGCEESLNNCTIGIEFHTPNYANGDGSNWYHFEALTKDQKLIALDLIADISKRHNIQPNLVLAHSDISLDRKTDPGLFFSWKELASIGYGHNIWSKKVTIDSFSQLTELEKIKLTQSNLYRIGYNIKNTDKLDVQTMKAISVFRLHFMQETWLNTNSSPEFVEQYKNLKTKSLECKEQVNPYLDEEVLNLEFKKCKDIMDDFLSQQIPGYILNGYIDDLFLSTLISTKPILYIHDHD